MISFWLGIVVALLVAFLIVLLFIKIWKWIGWLPAGGGVLGFFVGVGLGILMVLMPGRVYILTGEEECSHSLLFWSTEYVMKNGTKVTIEVPFRNSMVINDTEHHFELEKVIYGGYDMSLPEPIEAGKQYLFPISNITYFFNGSSAPHDEIRVKNGETVERYWLR